MRRPVFALAPLALLTLLALAACGTPTESPEKIAEVASDALADEVGEKPDNLDCGDEDITIEKDNSVDCVLTHDGQDQPTKVTITEVDGRDYEINVQFAESADKVASVASDALAQQIGQAPDDLSCGDEDVALEKDNTVDCVLTHGGQEFDTEVTITEVDGLDYRIDVQVAETPRN